MPGTPFQEGDLLQANDISKILTSLMGNSLLLFSSTGSFSDTWQCLKHPIAAGAEGKTRWQLLMQCGGALTAGTVP